jgi:hypothetical protein
VTVRVDARTVELAILAMLGFVSVSFDVKENTNLFPSFADGHTIGLWLIDEPQCLNMTLTDPSARTGTTFDSPAKHLFP